MLQEEEKQLNERGLRGEQSSPHSPPPAVLGPLRAVKLASALAARSSPNSGRRQFRHCELHSHTPWTFHFWFNSWPL